MMKNQNAEYGAIFNDKTELHYEQQIELKDEVITAVTNLLDHTNAEGFTIPYERNETALVIKVEEAVKPVETEMAQSSDEEECNDVLLKPEQNFKLVLLKDDYGDKQFAVTYRTRRKFGGIEQDTVESSVLDSKSLRYLRVGNVDGQWFVINGTHKPYNSDRVVMKVLSKNMGYEIIQDIMSLIERKEDKTSAEKVNRWSEISRSLCDIAALLVCVAAFGACIKYIFS